MGSFIDLHIHSVYSDGSLTPEQIVLAASELGLYAIAITDHDSTEGIIPAVEFSAAFPVKVVPGVELSCAAGAREIHLLGYNIDPRSEELNSALEYVAMLRNERNSTVCSLLRKEGVDISMNDLRERFGSHMITMTNFAIYLVEKGYAEDKRDAYKRYIGINAPCRIPKYKIPLETAARLIKNAGGCSVVAHPVQYRMSDDEYMEFFVYCKSLGIGGIEAIYSANTKEDEEKFKAMAKRSGMFITGGSDYHGDLKPGINIGTGTGDLKVPGSILKNIGFE